MSATSPTIKFPQNFWEHLLDQLKKQGFSVVMLMTFGYVFFVKSETCNETVIRIYQEERVEMIKVINANTRAIETFSKILENQKNGR